MVTALFIHPRRIGSVGLAVTRCLLTMAITAPKSTPRTHNKAAAYSGKSCLVGWTGRALSAGRERTQAGVAPGVAW